MRATAKKIAARYSKLATLAFLAIHKQIYVWGKGTRNTVRTNIVQNRIPEPNAKSVVSIESSVKPYFSGNVLWDFFVPVLHAALNSVKIRRLLSAYS